MSKKSKEPFYSVTLDVDKTRVINSAIKRLGKMAVYIGIPADGEGDERKKGTIRNSDLGYIHEFGSETAGIPPRPFLKPGVESVKDELKKQLQAAAKAALKENDEGMLKHLKLAAGKGERGVRNYMRNAPFEPIKLETAANRYRDRGNKGPSKGERAAIASGSTEGLKPLINTGQLRNAITGIVEEE